MLGVLGPSFGEREEQRENRDEQRDRLSSALTASSNVSAELPFFLERMWPAGSREPSRFDPSDRPRRSRKRRNERKLKRPVQAPGRDRGDIGRSPAGTLRATSGSRRAKLTTCAARNGFLLPRSARRARHFASEPGDRLPQRWVARAIASWARRRIRRAARATLRPRGSIRRGRRGLARDAPLPRRPAAVISACDSVKSACSSSRLARSPRARRSARGERLAVRVSARESVPSPSRPCHCDVFNGERLEAQLRPRVARLDLREPRAQRRRLGGAAVELDHQAGIAPPAPRRLALERDRGVRAFFELGRLPRRRLPPRAQRRRLTGGASSSTCSPDDLRGLCGPRDSEVVVVPVSSSTLRARASQRIVLDRVALSTAKSHSAISQVPTSTVEPLTSRRARRSPPPSRRAVARFQPRAPPGVVLETHGLRRLWRPSPMTASASARLLGPHAPAARFADRDRMQTTQRVPFGARLRLRRGSRHFGARVREPSWLGDDTAGAASIASSAARQKTDRKKIANSTKDAPTRSRGRRMIARPARQSKAVRPAAGAGTRRPARPMNSWNARLKRIPSRARRELNVIDVDAEPRADAGADRHDHHPVGVTP